MLAYAMGAHGTLEEALVNVDAFARADAAQEHAQVKKSREKERNKDGKKDKKPKKERHGDRMKVGVAASGAPVAE